MGTRKRPVTRFTRNERTIAGMAQFDAGLAVRSLLEFANHAERPWRTTLPWTFDRRVHGQPPSEPNLTALQHRVAADLQAVIERRYRLGSAEPLRVVYAYDGHDVSVYPPNDDLAELLLWTVLHLLADQQARHLKRCPICSRFFHAERSRARFCGPTCQDAHFNACKRAAAHRVKLQRVYGPRHPRKPRKA
jgi:hypothetical protein